MKRTISKKYMGPMVLGLLVMAACDNMTGSMDTAEEKLLTQAFDLTGNIVGVSQVGVDGVYIDPIADLELSAAQLSAGYDVYVTGYVGYLSSTSGGSHPKLKLLSLEVREENDPIGVWEEIGLFEDNENELTSSVIRTDKSGREFNDVDIDTDFIWTIESIGKYTIKARAEFTRANDYSPVEDTEDVVVTLEMSFEVEFPAAPAIAARILEANNVPARYGSGRTGGNYISDVAKHMGPGTDFDGESKELWVNDEKDMNQAYWDAVWDYLKGRGLSLPNAPEGYIW